MESNKLEISNKAEKEPSLATYKQIPESDLEEEAVKRPKKLARAEITSKDGEEEKMLPDDEKISESVNASDIKFTANEKQNGDAKLEIGDVKLHYVGMSKEELMKYANDPFWVRLRWFLFIAFWTLWAAMLIGAILIIVAAPKCSPPEPRTWWEQGPLIEVKEDVSKEDLEKLQDSGIQGIILSWLSTLDVYTLLNETGRYLNILTMAKELDLNVIVDLSPAASDKWFQESENKDEFYKDYYIWQQPKGVNASGNPEPPNNWISKLNRSSWSYSDIRKEFYYSPGTVPHLNFRNPNVINEFSKVIINFLDNGAKGIRLHGASYLLVDYSFANEAVVAPIGFIHTDYGFYSHTKTENLPEIGELLKKWRDVVKNKTENGPFMLAEDLNTLEPFKFNNTLVIDLPRHSKLFSSNRTLTSSLLYNDLQSTFTLLEHNWPLWELNNNAVPSDVMNILVSLLPGVPLLHDNKMLDAMLLRIRSSPSIMYGTFHKYEVANKTVFAYVRGAPGNPGYLVAVNPSEKRIMVNFHHEIPGISAEITVQYMSSNFNETNILIGQKVEAHAVLMPAESAGIFTYVPKSA